MMMMTMMKIAGIGKIEEPGDGWRMGVAGGGSWLSVAGGALEGFQCGIRRDRGDPAV